MWSFRLSSGLNWRLCARDGTFHETHSSELNSSPVIIIIYNKMLHTICWMSKQTNDNAPTFPPSTIGGPERHPLSIIQWLMRLVLVDGGSVSQSVTENSACVEFLRICHFGNRSPFRNPKSTKLAFSSRTPGYDDADGWWGGIWSNWHILCGLWRLKWGNQWNEFSRKLETFCNSQHERRMLVPVYLCSLN